MKAYHHDACGHTRPRDRFLGSVDASEGNDLGVMYDVYVYQDNALDAETPDMHVCIRYGEKGEEYISPGNVDRFLERVRKDRKILPAYYWRAAQLIEKWASSPTPVIDNLDDNLKRARVTVKILRVKLEQAQCAEQDAAAARLLARRALDEAIERMNALERKP
jgi:hypothetical protein